MGYSNGKITAPVGFGDIQRVLNTNQNDLARIIRTSAINPFAKYKPVKFPAIFTTNHPYWWMGNDGRCGVNYPIYTSLFNMIADINAGVQMYDYIPPTGGTSEPYRATDFNGYNHNAICPILAGQLAAIYYKNSGIHAFCNRPQVASDNLSVSELYEASIANFYYGIAVTRQNTNNADYITENDPLNVDGGGGVTYPGTYLTANYYYDVFQFVCANKKTSLDGAGIANTFIPIMAAGSYKQTIQLLDSAVEVQLIIDLSGTNTLSIRYKVINRSSQTANITNPYVTLRYADNPPGTPDEIGEGTAWINSLSVPAGATLESTPYVTTSYLPNVIGRGGYGYGFYTLGTTEYSFSAPIKEPY